jgi:oligopeptide/dipeptide ABC transporter ATP-binding protein
MGGPVCPVWRRLRVAEPSLRIEDLHVSFFTLTGEVRAINGVSLEIYPGEFFGLVGETGCGKTVTGLAVLGLVPKPGRITHGRILFQGRDLLRLSSRQMRRVRGGDIAMIFQNPSTCLNPVFTIGSQLARVIRQHQGYGKHQAEKHACELLEAVGLPEVKPLMRAYPHELSGGMLQRVMIAMALSSRPSLLIADEPTTALDVTIQAQILALLWDLQNRFDITTLLITHDLGVIAETCDRTAVLYAGQVAEIGPTAEIFHNPYHPYTQGLIRAVPRPDQDVGHLAAIPGTVPSNPGFLSHCLFAPRCSHAWERCWEGQPAQFLVGEGHRVACFLYASQEVAS